MPRLPVVLSVVPLLVRSGVLRPMRPDRLFGTGLAFARWGVSLATGFEAGAIRHPDRLAVIGEDASVSYRELRDRSNALAQQLRGLGVDGASTVGLLARNSAAFVVAVVAISKLGADLVFLNTGFAGPALGEALASEGVTAVVHDGEFASTLDEARRAAGAARAAGRVRRVDLDAAFAESAAGARSEPPLPAEPSRYVILTSGTTGRAKGAAREMPPLLAGLEPLTALLEAIPLRAGETTVVAVPMFHSWGFGHLSLGALLGSTLVVTRRFEPRRTVELVAENGASVLAVVPVMLQRMLQEMDSGAAESMRASLRVVAVSGSALPVAVGTAFMDVVGDVIYNLYGSTEVAYASIADPADLRAAPGTVGRPLRGATVRILGPDGAEMPDGTVGRIFVGNAMGFAGYTGGGDKERVGGLVSTGDVGRFDRAGRLFVEGRDDEMVVSGGENVFPQEVTELLLAHPEVADACVVGVPDEEFGARLVAHLVAADAGLTADAVREYVRTRLARFKVPRDVVFHGALPRNETGKVLARVLREQSGTPRTSAGD